MFNLSSYVGLLSWSDDVRLVSKINTTTDYYKILGVGNNSSTRDIHHEYRNKWSVTKNRLTTNKTPGSDKAIKKIEQAFKCLVDPDARTCYDKKCKEEDERHNGDIFFVIVCVLNFACIASFIAVIVYLNNLPYSMSMDSVYEVPMMTKEYEIEFYVKSSSYFDTHYPIGTRARANIENNIIKEYISIAQSECDSELITKQRIRRRDFPTPNCDKLQSMEKLRQDKISKIDKAREEADKILDKEQEAAKISEIDKARKEEDEISKIDKEQKEADTIDKERKEAAKISEDEAQKAEEADRVSEIDKAQKEEHVDDHTQSNVEELEEIRVGDPTQSHTTIIPSEAESSIDHNRKTEEATKTYSSVHDIQRDREELRKKLNAEMKKVLGLTTRDRNKAVRMLAHDEDLMVIFFTVEDADRLDWILDMFKDSV